MIGQLMTLRASAAQTAGTVNGTGVSLDRPFSRAEVTLVVSAAKTAAGDTLDVYVDKSLDGGTTWFNIGHFTQVLGNGGAKKFTMSFAQDNPGATAVIDSTSDAAAGATRQSGIGSMLRVRGTVVETSDASFTWEAKALLKP